MGFLIFIFLALKPVDIWTVHFLLFTSFQGLAFFFFWRDRKMDLDFADRNWFPWNPIPPVITTIDAISNLSYCFMIQRPCHTYRDRDFKERLFGDVFSAPIFSRHISNLFLNPVTESFLWSWYTDILSASIKTLFVPRRLAYKNTVKKVKIKSCSL